MRKLKLQELNRVDLQTFKAQAKAPIALILDNVRSGLNVGSAFRTADAFALEKIYLCGITAQPPHREILKTAIGATESIDWEYRKNTKELVQRLIEEGWEVIGVEQTDESVPLHQLPIDPNNKYALVFGNEVNGISEEVVDLLQTAVEVPQFGTKHSLNISVCIGIVVWEMWRRMTNDELRFLGTQ